MGLDGVELIMAVEEEFEIAISESDAAHTATVGKFVDMVDSYLRHSKDEPCPSQQGFHVIRRHLMDQFNIPRTDIKANTKLTALIPETNRCSAWEKLIRSLTRNDIKTKWPYYNLVRPVWLNLTAFLILPAVAFMIPQIWLPVHLCWIGAFPAIIVGYLGARLTLKFKTKFPPRFTRVKDLIQFVKTLDPKIWTKEEVFEKIREITVEQLGVLPDQVTLDARWVEDLGVG